MLVWFRTMGEVCWTQQMLYGSNDGGEALVVVNTSSVDNDE